MGDVTPIPLNRIDQMIACFFICLNPADRDGGIA
jgi:hypothetical protein